MRLVSFDAGGGPRAALLREGRVEPVAGGRSLEQLLADGRLDGLETSGESVSLEDVTLLPPVTRPGKIVCIGLNYRAHADELGTEAPETPAVFAKFANALVGSGATVKLPPWSDNVDYEAEVAFVIGTRARGVSEADALGHVAGYTLFNDLSARDYQFRTPQWMPGKVFDGAAPCGPALVTPDEAGPPDAIGIGLTLNGQTMQESSTADLVHSVPALVAHLSQLMTLDPGDLVATGTPSGVGMHRDPEVWLRPGDRTEVFSPQLGVLETSFA
jgi:2-keto-4-pentenoate hydratase/2-oxohepta-3-ene-1,7-dioic acid hydratase in catechol pathway